MAEIQATILIPDISGFTEFVTTTELSHSTLAINILLDSIVKAVGDTYYVSEIEGDAVLLIKKDPAPSSKEVFDFCIKIFNAFHYQRSWLEQHTVCPCKACLGLSNLTLKFVAHRGPLAEINVGRFTKHSGAEMIVAHRLLKNSIANNEYLLMTDKVMPSANELPEISDLNWNSSFEEFASIGKVGYHFTLLNEQRKSTPQPPPTNTEYRRDETPFNNRQIAANYKDVYMQLINIPERDKLIDGLQKVEQDTPVFVGSVHTCTFHSFVALVSPFAMSISNEEISYAELWKFDEERVTLEVILENLDPELCNFKARFMNTEDKALSLPLENELQSVLVYIGGGLEKQSAGSANQLL